MTCLSRFSLAVALFVAPSAFAADYDPPIVVDEAPEYQPVEIGSGWYLRGDLGYTINHLATNHIISGTASRSSSILSASVGGGYYFNDWLRVDGDLSFLNTDRYADTFAATCAGTEYITVIDETTGFQVGGGTIAATRDCEGQNSFKNMQGTALVNAYADLGTVAGFTPYLGAGIGLGISNYRIATGDRTCIPDSAVVSAGGFTTTTDFRCTAVPGGATSTDPVLYPGSVDTKTELNVAYALNAGIAYQVSKNTQIDLGYRYTAMPGVTYAYLDSGGAIQKGSETNFHQVRLGLRYQIW